MRGWILAFLIGLLAFSGTRTGVTSAARSGDDAAWAAFRAQVPHGTPLYRPRWLPDRFRQPGRVATTGPIAGVAYTSDEGDNLLFIYGASNSCSVTLTVSEPVLIHGSKGQLVVSPPNCYPQIMVNWLQGDAQYIIAGTRADNGRDTIGREEMLFIVAGLALFGPDGATVDGPLNRGRARAECYAQTGQCAAGPFLDYWRANGGLARNGYPLTGEMLERMEDGQLYQVQYFERVRMEYHQINAGPEALVLLGQFGRRIHGQLDPPVAPDPQTPQYFPETGHNLSGLFYNYWREHGLAQFGYPISEVLTERLEDGQMYQVQYFERARLEHHPENAYPYNILSGQFGRRVLAESGR